MNWKKEHTLIDKVIDYIYWKIEKWKCKNVVNKKNI